MSRITATFLSIATVFSSFFSFFVSPQAPEDNSEFKPVVRFLVASDSHVKALNDRNSLRVQKAMKLAYDIAKNDVEYNSLDAALFVGDVTDDGMKSQFLAFKVAMDAVVKDETEFMAVFAKSHDSTTMGKDMLNYASALTGDSTDFHKVVNGFHFIGISVSAENNDHYSDYQRKWLKAELDKAVAEDPDKPVFVIHHEHVANTVYGSSDFDGWGIEYFKDIFSQYPQVVHFSGHSHYPLNDPRSIWQDEFTAVGTGALYYVELTVDNERTYHPKKHKSVSSYWIVEVDENGDIRLRGMDLIAEEVLCEYILKNPANPENRDYTPEKRITNSTAPAFDQDATIEVKKSLGKYIAKVPAAKSSDTMPVFVYRAYVYDAEGNLVSESRVVNDYYSANPSEVIEFEPNKLPEGAATLKIIAENCYGKQSAPIEYNF